MAIVTSSGYHHVRIIVTDIARSKAFYDQVFGFPVAIDATDKIDDDGVADSPEKFYGGCVYQTPQGTLFGLRPVGSAPFGDKVTGLDHVSFAVDSREDLVAAAEAMTQAGIEHGEVIDLDGAGHRDLELPGPRRHQRRAHGPPGLRLTTC